MNLELRDLVRISLMAALIAALGLFPRVDLPIAGGVPITLQTLGVMLAGLVLGPARALACVALFIFVMLLGAPILAGGRGGLGVLFGPTLGYLVGWLPGAWLTGYIGRLSLPGPLFVRALSACLVGGVLAIHACGVFYLAWKAGLGLQKALLADLVFIPGDVLKALAAAWLAGASGLLNARAEKP